MTSSFRYPPQLLHSYTESQWLPETEDQQTSSLDRIEVEKQAHVQYLKRQVLPENIPDPIGLDDTKKFALTAQQQAAAEAATAALFGPPLPTQATSTGGPTAASAAGVASNVAAAAAGGSNGVAGNAATPLFWQKYHHQHQKQIHCRQREDILSPDSQKLGTAALSYGERLRKCSTVSGYVVRNSIEETAAVKTERMNVEIAPGINEAKANVRSTVAVPALVRGNACIGATATKPVTAIASRYASASYMTSAGREVGAGAGTMTAVPPASNGLATSFAASSTASTPLFASGKKSRTSMMSLSPDEDTTFDQDFDDEDDDDEDMVED